MTSISIIPNSFCQLRERAICRLGSLGERAVSWLKDPSTSFFGVGAGIVSGAIAASFGIPPAADLAIATAVTYAASYIAESLLSPGKQRALRQAFAQGRDADHWDLFEKAAIANPYLAVNQDKCYPLHLAATRAPITTIQKMIAANPYSTLNLSANGKTALHTVSTQTFLPEEDRLEVAKLLVKTNKSCLYVRDQFDLLPIDLAAGFKRTKIVRFFLETDLGLAHMKNRNGKTLLDKLIEEANLDMAALINRLVASKIFALGLVAAGAPNAPASSLKRFVNNPIFEPRLPGIVSQFLG
jgi:hypothetical protein